MQVFRCDSFPQPFSISLSTTLVPLTDVTQIDFSILLLFFLTTSPSPHLSFLLLTFLLAFSPSLTLIFLCLSLIFFCLLLFMWRQRCQKLIILFCLSAISLSLSSPTSVFVAPLTQLFIFLPLVNLFFLQSEGGKEECRLNCRIANNCTTLIAILHSAFRNNQIRL